MRRGSIVLLALGLGCTPASSPEPAAGLKAAAEAEAVAAEPAEAEPAGAEAGVPAPAPGPATASDAPVRTTPAEPAQAPVAERPPDPSPSLTPRLQALAAASKPRKTGLGLLDALVPEADRAVVTPASARALGVEVVDFSLWVTEGRRRAPLREAATDVWSVSHSVDSSGEPSLVVEYEDGAACDVSRRRWSLSARSLQARLENAAAMKPHRAGDFVASARGFARAAQLDPSLDRAWSNLACALAEQGEVADAMAALEPLIGRDPLRAYHRVLLDPELAPLREQPELVALRAPTPGTASIRDLTLAYSEHLGLVAMVRKEPSWGSMVFVHELELWDAATGQRVLTLPLIDAEDTDPVAEPPRVRPGRKARVEERLDAAERLLRDMGFSTSEGLEQGPVRVEDREPAPLFAARFARAGLGLAVAGGTARVLRGNEVLGVTRGIDYRHITRAGYDPEARVAFVEWTRDTPEGCSADKDGVGHALVVVEP